MSKRKFIGENPAPKVAKLSSFGFSIPRSTILKQTNTIDIEQTSKALVPSDISLKPSSPKTERKFNQKWTIDRPWLRYDRDEMTMYCDLCIKANLQNVFTTGCRMMKLESVKKHENRTGDNSHRAAIECIRGSKDMETATRTAHNKKEAAITSVMKNVYLAAQKHLPNSIIPELNDLCLEQGAVQLQEIQKTDGTFSYTHNDDIREFQQAIADTITDDIINKVNASPSFSVIIDESSDISVHQNLVVYIRVLEVVEGQFEAVTYFLGIRQLSGATAEKVTSEVLDVLQWRGIDVGKMSGISTDGAAVMVGCRNGVVTRLKQVVPGLLGTH